MKKAVTGLLALILASVICWSGTPVYGEGAETAEQVELYRYITFYDAAGGDVNDTVGFHVKNLTGTVREGYIEAVVNEWPEALNLGETDGYPRVIINYGMNQGRQKDITEECDYDPGTGIVRIPDGYRGEFLTVKSVMSDSSSAYQLLVPEEYRVNKNLPMPMLSYEDGPADDTDWAVYGVIPGSCNDTAAMGISAVIRWAIALRSGARWFRRWPEILWIWKVRWISMESWACPNTAAALAGPALRSAWTAGRGILSRISEIREPEAVCGLFRGSDR